MSNSGDNLFAGGILPKGGIPRHFCSLGDLKVTTKQRVELTFKEKVVVTIFFRLL